jgi:hypothetical protein
MLLTQGSFLRKKSNSIKTKRKISTSVDKHSKNNKKSNLI